MASSKSRACSPSIVTTMSLRKSVRPAISCGCTAASRARASATASGAWSSGMPCLRNTTSVSTPGSSSGPSTSTMRPAASAVGPGQRVISTVTMSPSAASSSVSAGTRMSVSSRASKGRTSATPRRSRRNWPTMRALRRSSTSRMRPSRRSASRPDSTRATTRSPCMAPPRRDAGMNRSAPPPSGITKAMPLACPCRRPVTSCTRSGSV